MARTIFQLEEVGVHFNRRRVTGRTLANFVHGLFTEKDGIDDFFALSNVTLTIREGERIGIVGRNGAGKSTLLRVLSGVILPQRGKVLVTPARRVTPLLELGIGFHPDLTGRENCYLGGALLGIGTRRMRCLIDEIITFAELEEFIDQPVKTYSSGMYARLAFSLATSIDPDVLILDEVFAVGDQFFVKKSIARMQKLMSKGITVILVSHNIDLMVTQCQRLIWLDHGRVRMDGESKTVASMYRSGG